MFGTNTADYFYDGASDDITYGMNARLKYTWNGQVQVCQTSNFGVGLGTNGSVSLGSNTYYGSAFNTTTGVYIVVGSPTIPALSSGCDSAANRTIINSHMAGGAALVLGQSATNPQLLAPY